MAWFWLSFADPDRPTGEQFLGVAIVEGVNMLDACHTAHELMLNPGAKSAAGSCRSSSPTSPAGC